MKHIYDRHYHSTHNAIRACRPLLAVTHLCRRYALFHHTSHLTSWHTLMAYLVLSPNGEESFNKFLSPDPAPDQDHVRRGPSHGYNTSCVQKSSQSEQ